MSRWTAEAARSRGQQENLSNLVDLGVEPSGLSRDLLRDNSIIEVKTGSTGRPSRSQNAFRNGVRNQTIPPIWSRVQVDPNQVARQDFLDVNADLNPGGTGNLQLEESLAGAIAEQLGLTN